MSTQSGTYFLGTYGFPIAVTMGADLTGATAVNLKLTKPDGTVVNRDLTTMAVTDAPGGVVTYKPVSGEVDQVGGYSFEIKVDIGSTKRLVSDGQLIITQDPSASAELIVEDGTGMDDSNSYASVADGNDYHAKHLYASDWINSAVKAKALMMATRVIDMNVDWSGWKSSTGQALEWPRQYVPNNDQFYMGVVGASLLSPYAYGAYFPFNKIPPRLRDATCELARELLKKDRTMDYAAKGISRIGIGQGALDVSFLGAEARADRPFVFTDQVRAMLQIFGTFRLKRSRARVRRG